MSGIGMAMILQEQVEKWTAEQLEKRMAVLYTGSSYLIG